MSGWTALCLFILAAHVDTPVVAAIAAMVFILVDTPRQRIEKLERRVRELEEQ